jgi:formylmethanofuran dehydrogenase subunit E
MSAKQSDRAVLERCAAKDAAVATEYRVGRQCAKCGESFIAHRNSRAEFCCVCAVSHRRAYLQQRLGIGSDPLHGYPKRVVFQTLGEINAYLDNEKIECLLCGRHYRALPLHLINMHGIKDVSSYKMMHGIPVGAGLVGTKTSEMMAENSTARMQARIENGTYESFLSNLHAASKSKSGQRTAEPPAVKARRSEIMKAVAPTSPIQAAFKHSRLIDWQCADCGAPIVVREVAALMRGCVLLCKRCRYEHWSRAKRAWFDKNPSKQKEYSDRHHRKRRSARAALDLSQARG